MQRANLIKGAIFFIQMIHLVISNVIPESKRHTSAEAIGQGRGKSKPCWQIEKFNLVDKCVPCSNIEMSDLSVCKETGYKQLLKCEKTNATAYVSCKMTVPHEKQQFWKFEALSFAGAFLSNMVVWWRRRALNRVHYQRVKRQMSSAAI